MLRLYLSKEVRLHVWDSSFKVTNVSTIHDHPWEFDSIIIAGGLEQERFIESATGEAYSFSVLRCGAGNCERSTPKITHLQKQPKESYTEGDSYTQSREEIHNSIPLDGTVTIITRRFTSKDEDHARVFWKEGDWVSAEPRPASVHEIKTITGKSLKLWFK